MLRHASPSFLSSLAPHLHACRDRKKSEKEAAKQRKINEEREAKETAARREQEAAQAAAEQAAVDRKARQFEKKAMQRQRSKLRSQCAGFVRGESALWRGCMVEAGRSASRTTWNGVLIGMPDTEPPEAGLGQGMVPSGCCQEEAMPRRR